MENSDKLVRAGIIGCGAYATGIVTQFPRVAQLDIPVIADTDLAAARRAYQLAGLPDEDIVTCEGRGDILRAMESGKYAVTPDPLSLMELPLDVIVESTGLAEAGALHALRAIEHGKHVAMVNKETNVTVGSILKHLADRNGVVYSMADGDQPGLLIGLVLWARSLGIEVVCGGKALDDEYCLDPKGGAVTTRYSGSAALGDDELPALRPTVSGCDADLLAARRKSLSRLIDVRNSDRVELVVAANATGLAPDVPSLHAPTLYTSEMPRVLCEQKDGGILSGSGRIEAVACLRMPHEGGLGGGVFITVDGVNEHARRNLKKTPVRIDDHPVSLITRPYHLLGLETIRTILAAGLDHVPTAAQECRPRYDVVVRARRDLKVGEVFAQLRKGRGEETEGVIADQDLEGFIVPAQPARTGAPIPIHMLDGVQLAADVPEGVVITRDLVAAPAYSTLWALRERQDQQFLPKEE